VIAAVSAVRTASSSGPRRTWSQIFRGLLLLTVLTVVAAVLTAG
jgi:hypothetical protein